MDKEQAITIGRRYKAEVVKQLPIKAMYLYGSYSKGNFSANSDIDIAVVVEEISDDYFDETPLLWKIRRKVSTLIEPILLCENTDNPLYADILKTGILL